MTFVLLEKTFHSALDKLIVVRHIAYVELEKVEVVKDYRVHHLGYVFAQRFFRDISASSFLF